MRKYSLFITGFVLIHLLQARADEGMWLLNMLQNNVSEMKRLGLELTPDQIYSINNSSLKDAVGALDYGSCTCELVSSEGLLLTNHHCGYGEIQEHSTVENDYLKYGFWAKSREEELPNPGKTVSFLIRIEDVTDQIIPKIDRKLTGFQLEKEIGRISQGIIRDATDGTEYEASVESFFNDNRYFLVVLVTYKDVRLVGAPPESIGKFGADTDNWMWPRHTGDFSVFRVYTGPDGKPAEYSPSNIPLKPEKYLPVSLDGYKKGDFAMTLGFPGKTDRYMTSFEVDELVNIEHPTRIKIRGLKQEIMLGDMMADEKVRIQYASKYSRSSNYWKYSIGQIEGLNKLDVISRKQNLEREFTDWIKQDSSRYLKYRNTLSLVEEGVNGRKESDRSYQFIFEAMYQGMESTAYAYRFLKLYQILQESPENTDSIAGIISKIRADINDFYKDYNLPTDKKLSAAMLRLVKENLNENYLPDIFQVINGKFKGNIDKFVDYYFRKSIFPYRQKLEAFLDNPDARVLEKDPAFMVAGSMLNSFRIFFLLGDESENKLGEGRNLWMSGLLEMQPEKNFYPDANSTIRLSYGTVSDYMPRDAVQYSYYTTLDGVMEKEDPDSWEFIVPDKLKSLYENKDYGKYGEEGKMHVCFITDNDITGGNSGSPVLNKRGELIGIAFDGNWEAMSGDISYEKELQKCISVDIRYVLFIMDKFAGASYLVDEMTVIDN